MFGLAAAHCCRQEHDLPGGLAASRHRACSSGELLLSDRFLRLALLNRAHGP